MKKKFFMMVMCAICVGNLSFASDMLLTDIDNHWAKESIIELLDKEIVSGYQDKTFKPENEITIMEFLKMLVEAGEYKLIRKGNSIYPDFYYETALDKGLISTDVYVGKVMTRNEMVNIISKFVDLSEVKESKTKFKDLDENNKSIVLKLNELKVISGYKDKTFRGNNLVTRAEAVTVISKVLKQKDKIKIVIQYDSPELSNYFENDSSLIKPTYEIREENILIYDIGRYAKLDGYAISDEKIIVKNVIKVIQSLITDSGYVAVLYVPSKYTINELKITYGTDEEKALCGQYDFTK